MRIFLCDDDPLVLDQLNHLLLQFFSMNHISEPEIIRYSNGMDLLADTSEKDIVFLDIEMPGMDGIYVGNELKKKNANTIIFVITSYSEYLDEAMRFHVFRYLSKPVDQGRLYRNLKDAIDYYNTINIKIPIETKDGVSTIWASSIIAVEAQQRKIIVHTLSRNYVSIRPIDHWLEILPKNCFFQTHRSYIVNFEHVTDFDHTLVHLANYSLTAYLTRRKYHSFKSAYLLYLESTR